MSDRLNPPKGKPATPPAGPIVRPVPVRGTGMHPELRAQTAYQDCAQMVPPLHFAGVPYAALRGSSPVTPTNTPKPGNQPEDELKRTANFKKRGF